MNIVISDDLLLSTRMSEKYEFAGCWSRRITSEHRLIYEVTKDYVRVLNCRHHYQD
jgi:Txe/YoeB family toxin of toxin-antitoxin system